MVVHVVGAGLAGLLAANMLRHRHQVIVWEEQFDLPNNHSAVLRFRTNVVGEVVGAPFRKVRVVKTTAPWRNPAADALAYSMKNLGVYRSDRSASVETEAVDRWIAPPDLIERMAERVDIRYGHQFPFSDRSMKKDGPIISTVPMEALMRDLSYPAVPEFRWRPGFNVRSFVHGCDAYVSVAVPDPTVPFSRVSITGEEMIVETTGRPGEVVEMDLRKTVLRAAIEILGISSDYVDLSSVVGYKQRYAKIAPIPEEERRKFIFWASTIQGRSFSLGRFATWRPGLLLDDLVNDVRVIERFMEDRTGYFAQQHEMEKTK